MNRQFNVILPEPQPHTKYHLFSCQHADPSLLCHSQPGLTGQDINRLPKTLPDNIKEYKFTQVLQIDSFKFAKAHQNLFSNENLSLCYFIFGDNEQTKESLVSAKPTKNSLVREVLNGLFKMTSKVFVSLEMMAGNTERVCRAKCLSYIEYLGLYRSFVDSIDDADLKKYHMLITIHYISDGVENDLSIAKLIPDTDEEQIQQILRLYRPNPIISRTSANDHKLCLMYWCPQPTRKVNPMLKIMSDAMRRPVRFATQTEVPSSASKIVRMETQSSVENQTRKKSMKKKSSEKNRCSNKTSSGSNLKRQIFKNVENQFNNKLQAKGRIMEIILQEKNKRIEELERMVQEKAEEMKAAHEEVKRILYEKNQLAESYQELEVRNKDLYKQIAALREESGKAKENQANIASTITSYEQQIETLHSDVKKTLDKLNAKNQNSKEEIAILKKEITQLRRKESSLIRKYEKQNREAEAIFEKKLIQMDQRMEKANEQSAKTQSDMIAEIQRYKNQLQEVFDKNQSLLDDNNRLNKQVKNCYEDLIKAEHKYGELCMKLRGLAHFKDSESVTLNNIIESL